MDLVRIILIDEFGRILLQEFNTNWQLPGGELPPNNIADKIAKNHIYKQTSFEEVDIGPIVGEIKTDDKYEQFLLAKINSQSQTNKGEIIKFNNFFNRWFHIGELIATNIKITPQKLKPLLLELLTDKIPSTPHNLSEHTPTDVENIDPAK